MVLRHQRESDVGEGAASGSDGNLSEVLDKLDEWTFIPESYVDSVFAQSDDLDSEGIYYQENSSLCVLKYFKIHRHWTIEIETKAWFNVFGRT